MPVIYIYMYTSLFTFDSQSLDLLHFGTLGPFNIIRFVNTPQSGTVRTTKGVGQRNHN